MNITRNQVEDLLKKVESAKSTAKRAREKATDAVMQVVQTTEVVGAGFTLGALNGRFGGVEVVGIPLDLLTGGGLHLIGMFLPGQTGEHLHNFGDGALCAFGNTLGVGIGKEMRQKAAASGWGGAGSHTLPPGGGANAPVTNQVLQNMAAGR